MILKDLIKDVNGTLGLPIDWDNCETDENYKQLFACARLVLNTLTDGWNFTGSHQILKTETCVSNSTLIYGILTEYAFTVGMLNEWRIWSENYKSGLFKEKVNGKVRKLPQC
jgi:hypothetical protein